MLVMLFVVEIHYCINLCTKDCQIINVRKVSSRFKYFLLIFVLRLEVILKMIGLDAELNSLLNAAIFKGEGALTLILNLAPT